jgi:tRNA-specific 2-thiouridylase
MYHTLGQRQGLGIGGINGAEQAAWYVSAKDLDRNVLVVAQGNNHPSLFTNKLEFSQTYWVAGHAPSTPVALMAKTRYRQADQQCVLLKTETGFEVEFTTDQRAITPGQSVVFYQHDICIGGGIIETTYTSKTSLPAMEQRVDS